MADNDLFDPGPGEHPTPDYVREACESSPAFTGVSQSAYEDIAGAYQIIHVPGGKQLIAQGRPHDCNYGVVHGRLRVVRKDASGRPILVTDLRRGDDAAFELLLGEDRCLYDLYAVRDSVLLRLSRDDFERVALSHADVLWNTARAVVQTTTKMLQGTEGPSGDVVNIAVVPASSHPRLSGVVAALAAAAPDSVPVAHLTAAGVEDAALGGALDGADPSARSRLIPWLEEQEQAHRLVLYDCDPEPTVWNEIALRQADRILVVAPGGTKPDPEKFRALLPDVRDDITARQIDLLLVHEPDTKLPTGTREWLDLGGITSHHHLRSGRVADFDRVVRRLTGRAVGVVLGGGGARGIAHVGVLKALVESGVPIDYVGGASMGSIVAAALGMGMSFDQMLEKLRETVAPKGALVDLTLPMIALTAGAKLERILRNLYGDLQIEDLWTPFFCNSTNITESRVDLHQRGSLWKSIRASISLPAIFPPVHSGDDLLVDGGVLDNLPIATMARLCDGGPVIAVDVSDNRQAEVDSQYDHTASGWGLFARKLNPFKDKLQVPNLAELITRCTVVGSSREVALAKQNAALYMKPPVENFGTLAFNELDDISRVGYEHAKECLKDWKP